MLGFLFGSGGRVRADGKMVVNLEISKYWNLISLKVDRRIVNSFMFYSACSNML